VHYDGQVQVTLARKMLLKTTVVDIKKSIICRNWPFANYRQNNVAITEKNLPTPILRSWASEGIFPGGPLRDFSKIFLGGGKSGEICFFPIET